MVAARRLDEIGTELAGGTARFADSEYESDRAVLCIVGSRTNHDFRWERTPSVSTTLHVQVKEEKWHDTIDNGYATMMLLIINSDNNDVAINSRSLFYVAIASAFARVYSVGREKNGARK